MGDYANVEVLLAESDFDPEGREFMSRLWDRYYGPAHASRNRPDFFEVQMALRDQAHADLKLPGLPRDWDYTQTEEIGGRRYYNRSDSIPDALIPPFPRRFADVYRLREKYGIRPIWYAMFSTGDWRDGHLRLLTTVGEARKRFTANLDAVWGVLFAGHDDGAMDALMEALPEDSVERKCLGRVFDRLPLADYLSVLRFLAQDWGGDAFIELNYYEVTYCYGEPHEDVAAIRSEFESTLRVFDALRRLDFAALPGEAFFESNRSYPGSGVFPWLEAYRHRDPVSRFQRWFAPDFYE